MRVQPEELTFSLKNGEEPTVALLLQNTSKTERVAFKVKTTQPKRYLVRPNQGLIDIDQEASVTIILQKKECEALLSTYGTKVPANDKFLVQSVAISSDTYNSLKYKKPKELGTEMSLLWKNTPKKDLANKKLRCVFRCPVGGGEIGTQDADDKPSELRTVQEAPCPVDSTGRSDEGSRGPSFDDMVELRRKYDEIVSFTVSLTAERDQFKDALDKAKKELHKFRAQASQLKRETNKAPDQPESNAGTAPSFSFWHILFIAVVAFVVGQLLATR